MGRSFDYDSSGSSTGFFIMAPLILILIPTTISRLRGSAASKLPKPACSCGSCAMRYNTELQKLKKKSKFTLGNIAFVLGWVIFFVLAYSISKSYIQEALYDPFEVLGISTSATAQEIKKKYRELSLKYHPDRNPDANDIFIRIAKAYETLTDEVSRENWIKYGNPDGMRTMELGIALPSWMVNKKNQYLLLFAYFLLFSGIAVAVYIWTKKSDVFHKNVHKFTLHEFYNGIVGNMTVIALLKLLSLSAEFQSIESRFEDKTDLPKILPHITELSSRYDDLTEGKKRTVYLQKCVKSRILLHAQMHGGLVSSDIMREDLDFILSQSQLLIQSLLDFSFSKGRDEQEKDKQGYLTTYQRLIHVNQLLIQGITERESPLMQIPHMNETVIKVVRSMKLLENVRDFVCYDDTTLNKVLASYSDQQRKDFDLFRENFPLLSITAQYSPMLERENPKDLDKVYENEPIMITIQVKRMNYSQYRNYLLEEKQAKDTTTKTTSAKPTKAKTTEPTTSGDQDPNTTEDDANQAEDVAKILGREDEDNDEEWAKWQKDMERTKITDILDRKSHTVHCPLFPDTKKQELWWIYFTEGKQLAFRPYKVLDLKLEKTIDFPHKTSKVKKQFGIFEWDVTIASDSYVGHEFSTKLTLRVEKGEPEFTESLLKRKTAKSSDESSDKSGSEDEAENEEANNAPQVEEEESDGDEDF